VAGRSKSGPNLIKFLQAVLHMYWAYIPRNKLVIAKNRHLNPFYYIHLYDHTSVHKNPPPLDVALRSTEIQAYRRRDGGAEERSDGGTNGGTEGWTEEADAPSHNRST
jgi:hypothetical protein